MADEWIENLQPLSLKDPKRDKWSSIRLTRETAHGLPVIVVQIDDAYICQAYDLTIAEALKVRDWLNLALRKEA